MFLEVRNCLVSSIAHWVLGKALLVTTWAGARNGPELLGLLRPRENVSLVCERAVLSGCSRCKRPAAAVLSCNNFSHSASRCWYHSRTELLCAAMSHLLSVGMRLSSCRTERAMFSCQRFAIANHTSAHVPSVPYLVTISSVVETCSPWVL